MYIIKPNIRQPNDIHKYDFIDLETKKNIEKNIKETKNFINEHLLPIINSTGEKLEGNIFMLHETTTYTNAFLINKVEIFIFI